MKKLLLTALLAATLAAGCRALPAQPTPLPSIGPLPEDTLPAPTQAPLPTEETAPSETPDTQLALTVLLPGEEGFTWVYEGYAQWGHTLTLNKIEREGAVTRYTLNGETITPVTDGSDHEGQIDVVYTVDGETWLQELSGASILESDYPKLVILRTPLVQGARWEQVATTADGTPITLDCTIQEVTERKGKTVFVVRYQQRDGDYYELREITTGLGITKFERFETTQGDTIGYAMRQDDAPSAARALDPWLPPGEKVLSYTGDDGFSMTGRLVMERDDEHEAVYCFNGTLAGGKTFTQRYYYDKQRGTLTQQAVSDADAAAALRLPLGNVVVLRFPLAQGSTWTHDTVFEGKLLPLTARVLRYDPEEGVIRIRYSVAGVQGYEGDTYIEERTFMLGRGMTHFGALLPGPLNLPDDAGPVQVIQTLGKHMFTYKQK